MQAQADQDYALPDAKPHQSGFELSVRNHDDDCPMQRGPAYAKRLTGAAVCRSGSLFV